MSPVSPVFFTSILHCRISEVENHSNEYSAQFSDTKSMFMLENYNLFQSIVLASVGHS